MPPLSVKTVVWAFVIVVVLLRLDQIFAVLPPALRILYVCLVPLKYAPEPTKVVLASLVLAFLFVVVWSFLKRKL